jgi:hypothetical protein
MVDMMETIARLTAQETLFEQVNRHTITTWLDCLPDDQARAATHFDKYLLINSKYVKGTPTAAAFASNEHTTTPGPCGLHWSASEAKEGLPEQ